MLSAVLDTCVLVPSRLRDVLLELASAGLYRPLWSDEILLELRDTLNELGTKRGVESIEMQADVAWLLDRMRVNFADAYVSDWERHQRSVNLPDPKDHHVAAAAIAGHADLIVTNNRKDFPSDQLPCDIKVRSPDDFLCDLYDLDPASTRAALGCVCARTGRHGPRLSVPDLVTILETRNHATHFAERMQNYHGP